MDDGRADAVLEVSHSTGNVKGNVKAHRPRKVLFFDVEDSVCCWGCIRSWLGVHEVEEISSFDELHDHPHRLHCDTVKLDEVWMIQETHDEGLLLKVVELDRLLTCISHLEHQLLYCHWPRSVQHSRVNLAKTTFTKEFVDGELVAGDAREISKGDIRGEFIDTDTARGRLDVMTKDKRVSTSNSIDKLDVFKLENGLVGLIVHDAVRAWD